MQASLDPVVEVPMASLSSGAFQRSARMLTQRCSISAVCGYSSLSIRFLSHVSAISRRTSGSSEVCVKVARLSRELPSTISSSRMSSWAWRGSHSPSGIRYLGTRCDGSAAA